MALERQTLGTGIFQSPTILMASSIVWCCLLEVHTLELGEMSTALSATLLSVTAVSSVTV